MPYSAWSACGGVLCRTAHGLLIVVYYPLQRMDCSLWRVMPYSAWIAYCSILSITAHGLIVVVYYPLQLMNTYQYPHDAKSRTIAQISHRSILLSTFAHITSITQSSPHNPIPLLLRLYPPSQPFHTMETHIIPSFLFARLSTLT